MPESRISLPADVLEPLSLRRTLSAIIDQLNIIIGSKGVDPYVKESDLPTTEVTLVTLNNAIKEVLESVNDRNEEFEGIEERTEELESTVSGLSNVTEYDQAESAMLDFNSTSWSVLQGLYQLSDLGENFVNPPTALTTGVTYIIYVQSFSTLGTGVVQEVVLENTTDATITIYKRAGDSFAQAIANGWLSL